LVLWAVLEELDQHEARTYTRFEMDTGTIAHFANLTAIKSAWR